MALQLVEAQRNMVYLKMALAAPSGGGKTMGALLIAYGMIKEKYPNLTDAEIWKKITIVDTENKSGQLYVNHTIGRNRIGKYLTISLGAPYTAEKYIEAIELCEENHIEVCIIDSTTHLWSGEGGLLEQQSNATKKTGNSYTAWRDITPMHNAFVQKMLQSELHIIATLRSKQEYSQEKNEQGKTIVKKLGMEPEQRKGMEYEFTVVLDIDSDHTTTSTKDRTSLFDGKTLNKITPEVGKDIMRWLNTAEPEEVKVISEGIHEADPIVTVEEVKAEIIVMCKYLGGQANSELMKTIREYTPTGNPNSINDIRVLMQLRSVLNDISPI